MGEVVLAPVFRDSKEVHAPTFQLQIKVPKRKSRFFVVFRGFVVLKKVLAPPPFLKTLKILNPSIKTKEKYMLPSALLF